MTGYTGLDIEDGDSEKVPSLGKNYNLGGCSPAGEFMPPYADDYNEWDKKGFFQITLGFGTFSFSHAKLIDVCWDVFVGRGGQSALAVISYVVFSKALLRIMEQQAVSYGTFEALTFLNVSGSSIIKLLRDYYRHHGWRARFTFLWIIMSSIWVAAFPTYTGAMTGYSSNLAAFVTDYGGSQTPVNHFKLVDYQIKDAHRLNLSEPFNVLAVSLTGSDYDEDLYSDDNCASSYPSWYYIGTYTDGESPYYGSEGSLPRKCDFVWNVNVYTQNYGIEPQNNRSIFNMSGRMIHLDPPTLDIRTFFLPSGYPSPNSNISHYYETESYDRWSQNNGIENALYSLNNQTYSYNYVKLNGICNQESTYKWGFSFLLLFIFAIIQTIWVIGMYVLWLDAHLASRFVRAGRDMGTHRAALDFSKAMRKDMGEEATELLGDGELKRRTMIDSLLSGPATATTPGQFAEVGLELQALVDQKRHYTELEPYFHQLADASRDEGERVCDDHREIAVSEGVVEKLTQLAKKCDGYWKLCLNALWNVCVDYEPAQIRLSDPSAVLKLLDVFQANKQHLASDPDTQQLLCDLVSYVCQAISPSTIPEIFQSICNATTIDVPWSLESFATLSASCVALTDKYPQQNLSHDALHSFHSVVLMSFRYLDETLKTTPLSLDLNGNASSTTTTQCSIPDDSSRSMLQQTHNALLESLYIACRKLSPTDLTDSSLLSGHLITLNSSTTPSPPSITTSLILCAFCMQAQNISFLLSSNLPSIITVLLSHTSPTEIQALRAYTQLIISFTTTAGLPARSAFHSSGLLHILSRFISPSSTSSPLATDIQIDTLRAIRTLISSHIPTLQQFLDPSPSEIEEQDTTDEPEPTPYEKTISLFHATDSPDVKSEISRLIAELCRTFSKSEIENEYDLAPALAPLLFTIHHHPNEGARIEAWMGVAVIIKWSAKARQIVVQEMEEGELKGRVHEVLNKGDVEEGAGDGDESGRYERENVRAVVEMLRQAEEREG
ncbi:MAG: hypothetical protein Q9227_009206 [Pyrenula ochraceoflavens]